MSAKAARARGIKDGLVEMVALSGWPKSTLEGMFRKHQKRWDTVILGCLVKSHPDVMAMLVESIIKGQTDD